MLPASVVSIKLPPTPGGLGYWMLRLPSAFTYSSAPFVILMCSLPLMLTDPLDVDIPGLHTVALSVQLESQPQPLRLQSHEQG